MKIQSKLVLIAIAGIVIAFNGIVESLAYLIITFVLDSSAQEGLPHNNPIWSAIDVVLSFLLSTSLFWAVLRFAQKKENGDKHYLLAFLAFTAYYVLSEAIEVVFISPAQNWTMFFSQFIISLLFLVALLAAILWSRKYYAVNEQELFQHSGRPMSSQRMKSFVWLSFISMLFPLIIYGLWIYAFTRKPLFEDAVAYYKTLLPAFMTPRNNPAYFGLLFCLLSLIFAFNGRQIKGGWMRFLLISSVVISALLFLLYLFSLM
jgi:hypothetical protein